MTDCVKMTMWAMLLTIKSILLQIMSFRIRGQKTPDFKRNPFQHTQLMSTFKKTFKSNWNCDHTLKENKALLHNKQVWQIHTCQGKGKPKKKNTYTKYIYTYFEKYLEILPKEWRGKIKYKQTVNCRVRKILSQREQKCKKEKKSLTCI